MLREKELETVMLDVIYVAATIIFFILAVAYVRWCDKLQ
jgi:hypothetical protein